MSQAGHISVLLIGLASTSSGSWYWISMLLAPAGSATTTTALASALASMLEHHRDHVGSTSLLISTQILPLVVVFDVAIVVFLLVVRQHRWDNSSGIIIC